MRRAPAQFPSRARNRVTPIVEPFQAYSFCLLFHGLFDRFLLRAYSLRVHKPDNSKCDFMSQEKNSQNRLFVSRLSSKMKDDSLTQKALADKAKIAQSTINAYLKGLRSPGAEELAKLSLALGVSMDWLWGMSDKTPTQSAAVKENVELRTRLEVAAAALRGALNKIDPPAKAH